MSDNTNESLRARIAALETENTRLRRGIFEPSAAHVVSVPAGILAPFAQAEASIRDRFGQIDVDPARAMIGICEERYLLIRASAFAIREHEVLVDPI